MTAHQRNAEPISACDFVRAIGAGFADGIAGSEPRPRHHHAESYAEGYATGQRFAPREKTISEQRHGA